MMKGLAFTKFIAALGISCTFAASHVAACTFYVPAKVELEGEPDNRAECRAVARDIDGFLSGLDGEAKHGWAFMHVAQSLYDGSANCGKDRSLAFALVNQGLGSPVIANYESDAVKQFREWKPADVNQQRLDEVAIGSWISSSTYWMGFCSGHYRDTLPDGYSESEARDWIVKPQYWSIAKERFGNNPVRDRIVLEELIDPESPYFNRAEAGRLVPQYFDRKGIIRPESIDVEVAEALTDPRLGPPDYEAAASILSWYSPFAEWKLSDDVQERARRLWVRIAQSRLTSADPQLRRDALLFFDTGDPWAKAGKPLAELLPAGSKIVALDTWPEGLDPLNYGRAGERIAHNYPSRAVRRDIAGSVDLGLVFGPDGSFHRFYVKRGTDPGLERAAMQSAERYLRPRISELVLKGFSGKYVFVPLPSFEYRLSFNTTDATGGYDEEKDAFLIFAKPTRLRY